MQRSKAAAQLAALLHTSTPIAPFTSRALQASASPGSSSLWLPSGTASGSKSSLQYSHGTLQAGLRALASAWPSAEPAASPHQQSAAASTWQPVRGLSTGHVLFGPESAGISADRPTERGAKDQQHRPHSEADATGKPASSQQQPRTASASDSASDRAAMGLDVAEQTMPDGQILRTLAGYITSADQPGLRSRIAVAMVLLLASKVLTIQVRYWANSASDHGLCQYLQNRCCTLCGVRC